MSPALVAVIAQVPLALVTLTVEPVTEQPVEAPALKVTVPVPLPPLAVAVPVVPYTREDGVTATVSGAWSREMTRTSSSAMP